MRKANPLAWPFLFATLLYGLGFLTLGTWSGVNTSSLYEAMSAIYPLFPQLWGIVSVAAVVWVMVAVYQKKYLSRTAGMLGWAAWVFACIIYILNGFWLVLFTVSVPNAYFWIWYYVQAIRRK